MGRGPKTARRDARSLYLLARAAEEDLNERAASGSAIVLAATGLGGELGFSGNGCESLQAGHGGVIGFVKCLAMEWPEVMVRAIDMNASQSIGEIVETLLSELRDPQGPLEVGSWDDRRVTWEPFSAPLETSGAAKIEINSSSVILLTGGARGITAAIAKELARRYQPTLILAGRSELIEESPETQPLATAAEIKKALIASLSTNGSVQMSKVEVAYNKLMRCREIRENIAAMEAAGSHVEYHAVDVRDETAVKRLIEHIVSSQGRLDGVIHGAGVIEDKLVKDKVPESFDRVFGTKVDSVAHLVKYLPQDKLKFMALFSSIASRFGNRGQSDYAAANEVLSKLAAELDRRWDARVFAVAWGPWSGTGMVSDLESHLTARGITLISPAEGADHLINEILYGSKGESEIMIAGGAAKLGHGHREPSVDVDLPRIRTNPPPATGPNQAWHTMNSQLRQTTDGPDKHHRVFVLSAASRAELVNRAQSVRHALTADTALHDLAATLAADRNIGPQRLAVIAATTDELKDRLDRALGRLQDTSRAKIRDNAGIYYVDAPLYQPGSVAFLYPGEGAQYLGMLAGLPERFPAIESILEKCREIEPQLELPVGTMQRCLCSAASEDPQVEELLQSFSFSIFAVMACSWCLGDVLGSLDITADMIAGHSAGESSALFAAGAIPDDTPFSVLHTIADIGRHDDSDSAMLAVGAGKTARR